MLDNQLFNVAIYPNIYIYMYIYILTDTAYTEKFLGFANENSAGYYVCMIYFNYISVPASVFMSVCLYVCLPICTSICLHAFMPPHLTVFLCLPVCTHVWMSYYLHVCQFSIYLIGK